MTIEEREGEDDSLRSLSDSLLKGILGLLLDIVDVYGNSARKPFQKYSATVVDKSLEYAEAIYADHPDAQSLAAALKKVSALVCSVILSQRLTSNGLYCLEIEN